MKTIIRLLIFIALSYFSFAESPWTYISISELMSYDSSNNCYERLGSKSFSIYKDKMCFGRYANLPKPINGIAVYENNNWKFIYQNDIKNILKNDTLFQEMFYNQGFYHVQYDRNGIIWGKVNKGIFKYLVDSIETYQYIFKEDSEDSFKIDVVYFLSFDLLNRPWIVVQQDRTVSTFNVCRFSNGRFIIVYTYDYNGKFDGYMNRDIICDKKKGEMWQLFSEHVIVYESWRWVSMIKITSLFGVYGYLNNIAFDNNNNLYILNNQLYLYYHNDSTWTIDGYVNQIEFEEYDGAECFDHSQMSIDSTGNVWVHNRNSYNLHKRNPENKWTTYRIPEPPPDTSGKNLQWYIEQMEVDEHGKIWLLADRYGIYIFDPSKVTDVEEVSVELRGLPDVWIRKLYPNPTKDKITVEFFLDPNVKNKLKAAVYNYIGEQIKDVKEYLNFNEINGNSSITFSVDDLSPGLYFIGLSGGNSNRLKSFIVSE